MGLDEHTWNKVYVQGIFLMPIVDQGQGNIRFGLNYIGRSDVEQLKLSSDRNHLNLKLVLHLIPDVFVPDIRKNASSDDMAMLSRALYEFLPIDGWELTELLVSQDKAPCMKTMADCLLEHFFSEHGKSKQVIPVDKRSNELEAEAYIFNHQVVPVNRYCLSWLRYSDKCPTLEKLRLTNQQSLMKLPEYVFDDVKPTEGIESKQPDDTQLTLARQIRNCVKNYFHVHMMTKLHFKDFSSVKNARPCISIKGQSQNDPVSVCFLDLTLLDPKLIHDECRQRDQSFSCTGTSSCGCVVNFVLDDILTCFEPYQRVDFDKQFRRKFLATLQPSEPAPALTNLAFPPTTSATPKVAASHPSLLDSIEFVKQVRENGFKAKPQAQMSTFCDRPSGDSLVLLESKSPGGFEVYVDSSRQEEMRQIVRACLEQGMLWDFDQVIAELCETMCWNKTACCFFAEDSERVGFYRDSKIFLSLTTMKEVYSKEKECWPDFCFVTLCHEMAHHFQSDHNEAFANIFGILILEGLRLGLGTRRPQQE
eukprot:c34610_g1_i1.p1 GENE.c34610_g1_i1~~c34610_g1_i1.p1  ORF type:complete len:535 (-),score=110.55 c34610_g1_i1:16-1620(-)